jgi:hypothetical protein
MAYIFFNAILKTACRPVSISRIRVLSERFFCILKQAKRGQIKIMIARGYPHKSNTK